MGALNRLMGQDPTLFNVFYEMNENKEEKTKDMDARSVKGDTRQPTAFEVYSSIKYVFVCLITAVQSTLSILRLPIVCESVSPKVTRHSTQQTPF